MSTYNLVDLNDNKIKFKDGESIGIIHEENGGEHSVTITELDIKVSGTESIAEVIEQINQDVIDLYLKYENAKSLAGDPLKWKEFLDSKIEREVKNEKEKTRLTKI